MAGGGFCEDCFRGTLRGEIQPAGTEETVHGLPTYVARPPDGVAPVGVVVIVADAFGWELRNNRGLADAYARRGPFLVYMPDFLGGCAPPARLLTVADRAEAPSSSWLTTLFWKPLWHLRFLLSTAPLLWKLRDSVTQPRIRAFFHRLRAMAPPDFGGRPAADVPIGVAGFCWGGRHAILLCGTAYGQPAGDDASDVVPPLVNCGFTAHPALMAIPRDLEALRVPLSVANGENDEWMGAAKMRELTQVLERPGTDNWVGGHEVVVYPGAKHGFAVRGDPNDATQAEHGSKAEDQAVAWFRRQFARGG